MGKRNDHILSILFGVLVGDALGLAHEFKTREELKLNPVTNLFGFGTHDQPPGTFSDDGSLTLCLAEALTEPFNLFNIADNFYFWLKDGYWAARGNVFDVGNTTRKAITNYSNGIEPEMCGGAADSDNGNGSLMRIAPLVFYIKDFAIEERYNVVKAVSSITHGHIRSIIACFYYTEYLRYLLMGIDKFAVYQKLKFEVSQYLESIDIPSSEIKHFDRLLKADIYSYDADAINSGGYVIDTLEASVWCFLTTDSYSDTLLKAVNLGGDTDTTGAVTGGLAGAIYGIDELPRYWIRKIPKRKYIKILAEKMRRVYMASVSS